MTSILRWKLFSQVSAGPKIPEQVTAIEFHSVGEADVVRWNEHSGFTGGRIPVRRSERSHHAERRAHTRNEHSNSRLFSRQAAANGKKATRSLDGETSVRDRRKSTHKRQLSFSKAAIRS
nr:hypothetical protein [Paraburkholderia sp. BL8N3]